VMLNLYSLNASTTCQIFFVSFASWFERHFKGESTVPGGGGSASATQLSSTRSEFKGRFKRAI